MGIFLEQLLGHSSTDETPKSPAAQIDEMAPKPGQAALEQAPEPETKETLPKTAEASQQDEEVTAAKKSKKGKKSAEGEKEQVKFQEKEEIKKEKESQTVKEETKKFQEKEKIEKEELTSSAALARGGGSWFRSSVNK